MPKSTFTLGDLEIATLEALWKGGEGDARGLHAKLGKGRGITLSTMQSTLERLYRKGLLSREKVSHAYIYAPVESRDTVMAKVVEAALHNFGTAPRERFMAAFSGYAADADDATLAALEKMIADRKRERGGGA